MFSYFFSLNIGGRQLNNYPFGVLRKSSRADGFLNLLYFAEEVIKINRNSSVVSSVEGAIDISIG